MTPTLDLLAQLWHLLTMRTDALSAAWGGFAKFPESLSRKAYAGLVRELAVLETLLRRMIFWDALQLVRQNINQSAPAKPASARSAQKSAAAKPAQDKTSAYRTPVFRLDEPQTRASRPFHAPRILSFDQIMAMPKHVSEPKAETRDTARLKRRLEAFYIAIHNRDRSAQKLARRLAKDQPPRLKPVRLSKRPKDWQPLLIEIDRREAYYHAHTVDGDGPEIDSG